MLPNVKGDSIKYADAENPIGEVGKGQRDATTRESRYVAAELGKGDGALAASLRVEDRYN